MNLSDHFTLAEFTKSPTALRQGIENVPTATHIAHLTVLCATVLEPARAALMEEYGPSTVVRITSGYRCPELNAAIGGSKTSAHMDGRAADIECLHHGVEKDAVEVFHVLRNAGLPFDQLIQECGPTGWNHLGIAANGTTPRGELLTATGTPGKWKYERFTEAV